MIVGSRRICIHLDAQMPVRSRLRPTTLAAAIDAQPAVVDDLPNHQMLMARAVGGSEAATARADGGASLSRKKVAWCSQYFSDHAGDAALVSAYTAERAKELSAAKNLFSVGSMPAAYARAQSALAQLDLQRAARRTRWLYADDPTRADLFWGHRAVAEA